MTQMAHPSVIKRIMKEKGFNTKKRFGQNFLIDQNIVEKIVASADLHENDWVLEIGPGLGVLTTLMAKRAQQVVAMEIDRDLVAILGELIQETNIQVIEGDALALDWEKLLKEEGWQGQPLKLVANLPYYLTTPLIMKALESQLPFSTLVVMVQREVADRILANAHSKDFGVLSLAVQYYCEPTLALRVPKTVFLPQPKVDSAVVHLKTRPPSVDAPREQLFEVIRASFQQRRKTIRNSLKPLLENWGLTIEDLDRALVAVKLEADLRGERLSLEDFSALTKELLKEV